jgi:hypothetical protein
MYVRVCLHDSCAHVGSYIFMCVYVYVVFGVCGSDVVLVIQRAPIVPAPHAHTNIEAQYASELWSFLQDTLHCSHVVLLCGASLQAVQDDEALHR